MAFALGSFGTAYKAARSSRSPRRRRPLLATLGAFLGRLLPTWATIRTFLLTVAGLALVSWAAFTVAFGLGLLAAGLSALLVEYLLSGSGS